jgi:hypothetical protein
VAALDDFGSFLKAISFSVSSLPQILPQAAANSNRTAGIAEARFF